MLYVQRKKLVPKGDLLFMLIMLVSVVTIVTAAIIAAPPSVSVDTSKALYIEGLIQETSLIGHEAAILQQIEEGEKEIHLVINSPGGDVGAALQFTQLMDFTKLSGVKYHCFVRDMAYSAAFSIYTYCDVRSALESATLMWHKPVVYIRGPRNDVELSEIAKELLDITNFYLADVVRMFEGEMSELMVRVHFEAATIHPAITLKGKALQTYRSIPGIKQGEVAKKKETN